MVLSGLIRQILNSALRMRSHHQFLCCYICLFFIPEPSVLLFKPKLFSTFLEALEMSQYFLHSPLVSSLLHLLQNPTKSWALQTLLLLYLGQHSILTYFQWLYFFANGRCLHYQQRLLSVLLFSQVQQSFIISMCVCGGQ